MINEFISPSDLIKNSKATLEEISDELGKTKNGTNNELVAKIWEERNSQSFNESLESYKDELFSHRGSYVCYKVTKGSLENLIKDKIEELLDKKQFIKKEDITKNPQLIGAYRLNDDEVILKVTYRVRYENRIENEDIIKIPVIEQTNILLDTKNSVVEVRSNFENSKIIINYIHTLDENLEFKIEPIDKDQLKQKLDATTTSSMGYTTIQQINLNETGKTAIEKIINFINDCLEDGNQDFNYEELQEQIDILREEEEVTNFVLLLLSGLGKLDLAAIFDSEIKEDLSKNSLYKIIEPFIEANKVYFSVPFNNNGLEENYTINVSLEKNIITFISSPNESIIRHIRSKIL